MLLPFAGVAAGLIATDTHIERNLPDSPGVINRSQDFSTAGVAALAATAGGLFLLGHKDAHSHRREAGLLSAEALADSFIVTEAFKYATRRQRPLEGQQQGEFWEGGNSFPSEHASAAWSIASVLAHEYPRPLPVLLAYGMATGVTATRVTGRRHFSSDVFIGSALGWFVGRQVFRSHHDQSDFAKFGRFLHSEKDVRADP